MVSERDRVLERSLAHLTLEGLLARVHSLVMAQEARLQEGLVALVAAVHPLFGVHAPRVILQFAVPEEGLIADRAHVLLYAVVPLYVRLPIHFVLEMLAALFARECFHLRMRGHVILETQRTLTPHLTLDTCMDLVFSGLLQ